MTYASFVLIKRRNDKHHHCVMSVASPSQDALEDRVIDI